MIRAVYLGVRLSKSSRNGKLKIDLPVEWHSAQRYSPGDLFILDKGLQSQENGWIFARRVLPGKDAPERTPAAGERGWIPKVGLTLI